METAEHMKVCEGFKHLWGDVRDSDDRETINFFLRVMKERADIMK